MSKRQPAGAAPARAHVPAGFAFGDFGTYSSGGGIPEGDYAIFFSLKMYQYEKGGNKIGQPTLSVIATAHNLKDPSAEAREQVLGMGREAHKSFMINPDTGTSLLPVPNGPQAALNNSTNWAYFLKSLYECGLPKGVFVDDISALNGIWVHIHPIPEPEERKSLRAKSTSEFEETSSGPKTMPIVTEFLPGGKPWEGGGGMPEGATPAAAPAKAATATAARRPAAAAAAKVVEASAELTDDQIAEAAANSIGEVLGVATNAKGMKRLKLRVDALAHASKVYGDEMSAAIGDVYFATEDSLNIVLNQLGYNVTGQDVKPQ